MSASKFLLVLFVLSVAVTATAYFNATFLIAVFGFLYAIVVVFEHVRARNRQ